MSRCDHCHSPLIYNKPHSHTIVGWNSLYQVCSLCNEEMKFFVRDGQATEAFVKHHTMKLQKQKEELMLQEQRLQTLTRLPIADPWPLSLLDEMQFLHYLEAKKVHCYPFEAFCEDCQNTWIRAGKACLYHGHEFQKTNPQNCKLKEWKSCIVFYDGYRSCYHGSEQFWIRGESLIDKDENIVCTSFAQSPFGKKKKVIKP